MCFADILPAFFFKSDAVSLRKPLAFCPSLNPLNGDKLMAPRGAQWSDPSVIDSAAGAVGTTAGVCRRQTARG